MVVTLVNDFHSTSIQVNLNYGELIPAKQIKVWQATLCGVTDCTCSGKLGIRGPQEDLWRKGLYIDDTSDCGGDPGDCIVGRH